MADSDSSHEQLTQDTMLQRGSAQLKSNAQHDSGELENNSTAGNRIQVLSAFLMTTYYSLAATAAIGC